MRFRFNNVAIESLGYTLPPEVWTSDEIEQRLEPVYERLKLPKGRLELMTGIRERRFWPADYQPSAAAAKAGEAALAKSSIKRNGISLLINASVCRDRLEPATASYVHGLLKLDASTQVLDISNACLGFCNAMVLAGSMIESGQIDSALIVSGENGRPLMDWTLARLLVPEVTRKSFKPYFANLTIGAGAVAAVLCNRKLINTNRSDNFITLDAGVALTDSYSNELCEGGTAGPDGLQMMTDSEALLAAGVDLAGRTWTEFCEHTMLRADDISRIVCHQVGKQHQRALLEQLGIPLDKDFPTYQTLGNVGSVSLPLTLAMTLEQGAVHCGDAVAGLGIGSGLCCMMLKFAISNGAS